MKKVYIASPLSAPTKTEIRHNMDQCRKYIKQVERWFPDTRAVALHHMLPEILDDSIPEEREMALRWGRELIATCDAVCVCGNVLSDGMAQGNYLRSRQGHSYCCFGSFSVPCFTGILSETWTDCVQRPMFCRRKPFFVR